jgi:hypothetical protein
MNINRFQPELSRWDSVANFNQPAYFDCGAQSAPAEYHGSSNDAGTAGTDNYFSGLERRDSMYFPAAMNPKTSEASATYLYPAFERKDSFAVSQSMKSADQGHFTVFELPSSSDMGFHEATAVKASRFDRRDSLISNNMPVSLPDISHCEDWNGNGASAHAEHNDHRSDSSCSVSSRSTRLSLKEDEGTTSDELAALKEGSFHMTRVDWRWAAMKGFWDKDKKCWIESAGGQAAYILQRMKRVKVREQRLARQAKAMQRLVPVQNLPFRSGLIEELPYRLDNDPWTEGLNHNTQHNKPSIHSAPKMAWFDSKPDFPPPVHQPCAQSAQGSSIQVFPFTALHTADRGNASGGSGQWAKPEAPSAPQWFEAAYANPAARAPMQAAWHAEDAAPRAACAVGSWW